MLRQIQHKTPNTFTFPLFSLQPAPLRTTKTSMMKLVTMMTIMAMPVMWKIEDHQPLLMPRDAKLQYICCVWDSSAGHWLGFDSHPDFSPIVTIIIESQKNNDKYVLLIPDKEAENALLLKSRIVVQSMKPGSWKRPVLCCCKKDWRSLLDCFFPPMWFRKCLLLQPLHLP